MLMSIDLRDRLSIEYPIVQAGMGGGVSGSELASAVSSAGGLGTIGITSAERLEQEIVRTRECVAGRPFAVNLLMPVLRRAHVAACIRQKVPVVTFFYGFNADYARALQQAGCLVSWQIGSVEEAEKVVHAGADFLIVQGHEAGGHIRGTRRLADLLPRVRGRFPEVPLVASGGIWERKSAAAAMQLGADGVAAGTRFLLTEESRAHEAYKQRLLEAERTVATTLFGVGWLAPHRVVPNAAVERWAPGGDPPGWVNALNRLSQATAKLTPLGREQLVIRLQSVNRPFYSPVCLLKGMDEKLVQVTPLYAGETVSEMTRLCPVDAAVREIAAGCPPGVGT
jgi:NAD(P)H-dependent flavin oxidoreductase YrpB (nitropropane dioxygenase family)